MEFDINQFSEATQENYAKIKKMMIDAEIPVSFKFELISLLKEHAAKKANPPFSLLTDHELIPLLINLKTQIDLDEKSIFHILWILTNYVSGSSQEVDHFIKSNGINYLLSFIPNDNKELVHQALWGLSNIVGESAIYRDLIVNLNLLNTIFEYFQEETQLEILKTVIWFMDNVSRGKPHVKPEFIKCQYKLLNHIMKFCYDEQICTDFLWNLAHITEINPDLIKDIMASNLLQSLKEAHFQSILSNNKMLVPFLRVLGNFSSDDSSTAPTSYIINMNIFDILLNLLESSSIGVQKEIAFIFSNIAAGTFDQMTVILNLPGLIEKIENIFNSVPSKLTVIKECCWILQNLFFWKKKDVVEKFKESGLIMKYLNVYQYFSEHSFQQALLQGYVDYYECIKEWGDGQLKDNYLKELLTFYDKYNSPEAPLKKLDAILLKENEDEDEEEVEVEEVEKMEEIVEIPEKVISEVTQQVQDINIIED